MELSILYAIPRTEALDPVFVGATMLAGSIGQLWLILAAVLLIFKKTRRVGAAVLISYIGVAVFGELILKHLFFRPRPCEVDQTFALLITRPTSSSFPSTHTAFSFGAATAIFMNYKRAGIAAFVLALLIAFSRLYLFVHFPTDVLCGAILGVVIGIAAVRLCDMAEKRYKKKSV